MLTRQLRREFLAVVHERILSVDGILWKSNSHVKGRSGFMQENTKGVVINRVRSQLSGFALDAGPYAHNAPPLGHYLPHIFSPEQRCL